MKLLSVSRTKRAIAGFALPGVIAFMLAMSIVGTATVTIILTNFEVVGDNVRSQQAFNIAEAGINYYLWHLSHNATDYKDGLSTPAMPDASLGYGPYVHSYIDDNAATTGTYTLWIKPQGSGSTLVTVRSIGKVAGTNAIRTIQAQVGAASFASYGLVADTEFWFGSNESANGPIFSNVGVHMDGANSDTVASANATYTPQGQYGGDGSSHPGVWCSASVTSPNCSTRNKTSWLYPKTSVDFNQVSTSLCTMKKTAFADYAATASLATLSNACSQVPSTRTNAYVPQRASNPTFHGRVTIASGRLASTTQSTNITIADQMLYTLKNGSDAIGLVSENDVLLAPYGPSSSAGSFNYEVDAAALAQSGSVTWPRYYAGTSTCTKGWVNATQTLTFYGSVATRQDWTWNYQTGGSCGSAVKDTTTNQWYSGIEHTNTNYDYNLLYAPPPSYPITGTYNILNWREVLTKP
jgi:hypothetical protein